MKGHVATAETTIAAPRDRVWQALTDPALVQRYMFGTTLETDWQPGSPITWSGEYEGKPYQDKGEVVDVREPDRLEVTHYSPMSGQPDEPDSYHHLVYELSADGDRTHLSLSQDGNGDAEEAERAKATWETVLGSMKDVLEQG